MTHRRARHVCAAAVAMAAVFLLPAAAGAHPADCDDTVLTKAPTSADWGYGSACGGPRPSAPYEAQATHATEPAGDTPSAARSSRSATSRCSTAA